MKIHSVVSIVICLMAWAMSMPVHAARSQWETHFAYNSVELIAVGQNDTYAMANGAIFSVNKATETLTKYDSRDGLQGREVVYIAYDAARTQLLIMYADGKMDVMRNKRMHYIPDLYNKRMMASKRCNNITIVGNKAYMSMEFGILVFDLDRYEFKDAYYIGKNGAEVQVLDVVLQDGKIYAKTAGKYYSASLEDNLVDYHYWTESTETPAKFDANKGKQVVDKNGDIWKAQGTNGVYRKSVTGEEAHYLPEGPQVNVPYRMTADRGRLYVVQGGRWASQFSRAGHVMIYEDGHWTNITQSAIRAKTGKPVLDFMSVAVDPNDGDHFFVTSYGTGLYEFQGTEVVKHYTPANSILSSAAPAYPDNYTRVSDVVFDKDGRVWVTVAGVTDTVLVAFMPNEDKQRGLAIYNSAHSLVPIHTPGGLLVDNHREHCKWIVASRAGTSLVMVNDNGTPFDSQDDKTAIRSEWYDQDNAPVVPEYLYTIAQAKNGDIWVGSNIGPIIIDHNADYLTSPVCRRLRIIMPDGSYLLETDQVNAFAFDKNNKIWIGTQTAGVYVLNSDATKIEAHYTSDNTPMPSNAILSLAYDEMHDIMYIGTGGGIVSCLLDTDTATNTIVDTDEDNWTYGTMHQWRAHMAYGTMDQVEIMGQKVYALSNGALFSVDKQSEEIEYYNRLTGLNGSVIDNICYNPTLHNMLITYQDGQLDIMSSNGAIHNIADLYLKSISGSKRVNDILMLDNKAYLAMDFGIIVLNMHKLEVEDTYYIGNDAAEIKVSFLTALGDSIYAVAGESLYAACLKDNLVDYVQWHTSSLPTGKAVVGMEAFAGKLCIVKNDSILYALENGAWSEHPLHVALRSIRISDGRLFALPNSWQAVLEVTGDLTAKPVVDYGFAYDIACDGNTFWLGTQAHGLVRINTSTQEFHPDGPISNMPYRLRFFGDRLYVLPGGRWASQNNRFGVVMYYENGQWTNITNGELTSMANHALYDVMNVAQDPNDKEHYFLTTYGTGLLEMQGKQVKKLYLPSNSPLESAAPSTPDYYTRTDGAIYDDQGNLWVLNAGDITNMHVMAPDGTWSSYKLYDKGAPVAMNTPGEIMIDNRNSQWKWIPLCRAGTGLILLQDNGTPTNASDDKVTYRSLWFDQQGKAVMPQFIYTIAQDRKDAIWVGTNEGLFIIPSSVDFATSNLCERVIIPRNDGSQLGDYLLGNEQINCIVTDGVNRKWIGTASSGVFLISAEKTLEGWDVETVAHFTTANSLLPDNNVLSIAIQESTGEVFIGTSSGLVSYMSDAVNPEDNFDNLYAYPNPVHPNYHGYITIKGLMDNSEVRITDANGNLVKLLQGNGGEAVWDGTNTVGKRVASGIYTAICNTKDGSGHGTTKILIMN